jgi:parallel beta-helix repeat protein
MVEKINQSIRYTIIFLYLLIAISQPLSAYSSQSSSNSHIITINQYQDIQEIINSAPINATIVFEPGVYYEPFQITKPLILKGLGKNNTFLNIETKPNNPAITITSPYVTLSNFTIINTASGLYTTAVRIDSPHVIISNSQFQDTPIGIAVWSNYVQIRNSSFINCADEGILLISTSISSSNNNLIYSCVFTENCDGIELQHSSSNIISYCVFKENFHAGIDAICDNNNNNTITNCSFLNNTNFDIYFSSSKHNKVLECDIENKENSIIFTPSIETNSISVKSVLTETIVTESIESIFTEENQSNGLYELIQSTLSQGYQFIQNLIDEIRQFIQKYK